VTEKQIDLKKGQRLILTILNDEILPEDEGRFS
jgi:hypothetical protein